jgi:hypothetical protein
VLLPSALVDVVRADPGGPTSIDVSGLAPAGKLAVTGSAGMAGICGA